MKTIFAIVAPLLSAASVLAITIDTVPVGNPGNPSDTAPIIGEVGSVAVLFRIGTTEITNAQYVSFLNAVAAYDYYGLYHPAMSSESVGGILQSGSFGSFTYAIKPAAVGQGPGGTDYVYANKPSVFITWASAIRFANWLHNGQPTGDMDASTTEDGAYTIHDKTDDALLQVTRNPGARWWIPSQSEWYKAAYFDPLSGAYYDYPTGTNDVPNNNLPSADSGNSANFGGYAPATGSRAYPLTNVGAYTKSKSPFGTFDQGGNAFEWTDTLLTGPNFYGFGVRGGSWARYAEDLHADMSLNTFYWPRTTYRADIGFRVATSVPEPITGFLMTAGLSTLFFCGGRKKRHSMLSIR